MTTSIAIPSASARISRTMLTASTVPVPELLFRADHVEDDCFEMADHDIGCIWFCSDYEEAEELAIFKKEDRRIAASFVYVCEVRLQKIAEFANEDALRAAAPQPQAGAAQLASVAALARSQGFDGFMDRHDWTVKSKSPWYGVLYAEMIRIVRVDRF